jgi:hypothetical protein
MLWSAVSRAEPIRLLSPSVVVTDGGSRLELPPGVFLPEADYEKLDVELRRLQDAETRLTAERDSYKSSGGISWGWIGAFVTGATLGYYLGGR